MLLTLSVQKWSHGSEAALNYYLKFNDGGISNDQLGQRPLAQAGRGGKVPGVGRGNKEAFPSTDRPLLKWGVVLAIFFGFKGKLDESVSGPLPRNFWAERSRFMNKAEMYHLLGHLTAQIGSRKHKGVVLFCSDERNTILEMHTKPVPPGLLDAVFAGRFFQKLKVMAEAGKPLDHASGDHEHFRVFTETVASLSPESDFSPKVELWKCSPGDDEVPFHLVVMNDMVSASFHQWIWKELNSHPVMKMAKPGSEDRYISVATTLPDKNKQSYFVVGKPGNNSSKVLHCYQVREATYPHDVALLNMANHVLGLFEKSVGDLLSDDHTIDTRFYKQFPVTMKIETFSPSNNVGFGSHTDADITNTRLPGEKMEEVALPLREELMTLTMVFCDPRAYEECASNEDRKAPGKTKYVYSRDIGGKDAIPVELLDTGSNKVTDGTAAAGKKKRESVSIGYNSFTLQGPGSQRFYHKVALADPRNTPSSFVRIAVTFRWAATAPRCDRRGRPKPISVNNLEIPNLWQRIRGCMTTSKDNTQYHNSYLQFKGEIHRMMSSMKPTAPDEITPIHQFKTLGTDQREQKKKSKSDESEEDYEVDEEKEQDDDDDDDEEGDGEDEVVLDFQQRETGDDNGYCSSANSDVAATGEATAASIEIPPDILKRAPRPFHHCEDIAQSRPPILIKTEASQAELMHHWEVSRSLLLEKRINIKVLKSSDTHKKGSAAADSFDLMLRDNDGMLMVPGVFYKFHLITGSGGMITKGSSFANPLCSTSEEHPKIFVLTKPYKSDYSTILTAIRASLEFRRVVANHRQSKQQGGKSSEEERDANTTGTTHSPYSGEARLPGMITYGSGGSDATGLNQSPDLTSLSVSTGDGLNIAQHAPTIVIGTGQPFSNGRGQFLEPAKTSPAKPKAKRNPSPARKKRKKNETASSSPATDSLGEHPPMGE